MSYNELVKLNIYDFYEILNYVRARGLYREYSQD